MKEMDKLNKLINENIKQKSKEPCESPQHMIPPLYISIPKGQIYNYKCPSCGHVTQIIGQTYELG